MFLSPHPIAILDNNLIIFASSFSIHIQCNSTHPFNSIDTFAVQFFIPYNLTAHLLPLTQALGFTYIKA
jgi:hypothetical protein